MRRFNGRSSEFISSEYVVPAEKYSVPFSWGSVHVSEQADEAYKLHPLITKSMTAHEVGSFDHAEYLPDIDIWIVGPDELGEWSMPPGFEGAISLRSGCRFSNDGIEMIMTVNKNEEQIMDILSKGINEGLDEITDEDPPDIIAQNAHQHIAHSLVGIVTRELPRSAATFMEGEAARSAVRGERKTLIQGFLSAAFISSYDYIIDGRLNVFSEMTSGALLAGSGVLAYRGLRDYIKMSGEIRTALRYASVIYSQFVAEDLHKLFCSRSFDHSLEGMMDSDSNREDS